jgi:hypothetical protein
MRFDHLDFMDICRDEHCSRQYVHSPHRVRGKNTAVVMKVPLRRLLLDITLEQVSSRVPKTFGQIFTDVYDEYGSITDRNVRVALRELRDAREVAFIVPSGSQGAAHTEGVRGAYLRYDSPLLWRRDGLVDLMDLVQEMTGSDGRIPSRSRRQPLSNLGRVAPDTFARLDDISEVEHAFGN